jgi:hypothetical protein
MNDSRLQSIAPTLAGTIENFSKIERLNAAKKIVTLVAENPEVIGTVGVDLISKMPLSNKLEKKFFISLAEKTAKVYDEKYFDLTEIDGENEVAEDTLKNFCLARAFAAVCYALDVDNSNSNLCEAVYEANASINDIEKLISLINSCKVI